MDIQEENIYIKNDAIFKGVYDKYFSDLKRFLYFKFGDLASAEDVAQDAFVKLWNNKHKVTVAKAKSFLFTVANNQFLNIKKHEKVILKNAKRGNHINNETPSYLMEEKEFHAKIKKVISNLPEKQREVFLLSRIEKLKYKEIAEQIGLSVKAVEKRMHQALIVIRKEIGNV